MAKVKDIAMQIRGVSYHPEDLHDNLDEDSVVLLRANNIKDGKLILDDVVYVSKSKVAEQQYLQTGDILICASSGSKELVGKAAFVDSVKNPMTFGAFCKVVRPQPEYSEYLGHYFNSPVYRRKISALSAGANINNIKNEHIDNLDIQLVDEKERREIITILNELNMLISLRKQQLFKLDELIKARFVEMFGDPVNNPMNYPKSQLGKVCDVRDGTHDSPEYYDVGYPLVTSKNVTGGKIDLSECNLISEDDYKKICERSKVDRGDIIMPMIGTVGKPVIVNIEPMFAIKNVALIKFTPDSLVTNIYIKTLLESDYFDRAVLDKIRGGTQKFIALGDIRKLEIVLPDLKHQQCFSAFVERVDQQKQTVQQSLEKLELMKKALMQEYFG